MPPREEDPDLLTSESPPVLEDSPATISLVGDGAESPTVNFNWSRYWPFPVAGAMYLAHLRWYRSHIPRRLPTITSMSLRELYGTGACLSVAALEVIRLSGNLARDRDLLTIEVAAALSAARSKCYYNRNMLRNSDIGMDETMARNDMYVECARRGHWADRIRWFYDHMWSDIVMWNCAWIHTYSIYVKDLSGKHDRQERVDLLPKGDMDICITHFANTACALHGGKLLLSAAAPFATAFCGITPLAMLARWAGPRMLWLTLNGIQRSLTYTTAWLAAAQIHQHYAYLPTLQDKHGVAEMLRRADPELDKEVDDIVRKASEGIVIAWPGW